MGIRGLYCVYPPIHSSKLTLYVGNGVKINKIESLSERALVGRMEHTWVSFVDLKACIVENWKSLLKYTPLFSSLINGWFNFHFLTVADRELISERQRLIGKGSIVLT